jgi:hypothetical protein
LTNRRCFAIAGATLACTLGCPLLASAGPDGEVASSFDDDDRFDLHLTLDYDYGMRRSSILRERVGEGSAGPGDPMPLGRELVFDSIRHTITPRAELGIYKDVALTFGLPIVVLDTRELSLDQHDTPCTFTSGPGTLCVDRDNSTTIRDGLLPAQGFDASDPATSFPGDGALIFRGVDRKGLDQLHLGLVVAPMNQMRDDTKPTWKLGAELRLAVGRVMRFDRSNVEGETGVSPGVHELRLYTSVDKRVGWAEPYFEAWWKVPIGAKAGSPFATDPGFGAKSVDKQQEAGTRFGFEAITIDRGRDGQRVSLDFSANFTAHFEGRGYSEMWEVYAFAGDSTTGGPLILDSTPTMTGVQALSHPGISNIENYLEGGGRLALNVDLGPLVHVAVLGELTRESRHIISFADAGTDLPQCDPGESPGSTCEIASNDVVNPDTVEVNPVHVPLIDLVGHRYVSDGAANIRVGVEARILF